MSGMESSSRGFEKSPEFEPAVAPDESVERSHRGLGHTALDSAGVAEPSDAEPSAEVVQSLGSTALKDY